MSTPTNTFLASIGATLTQDSHCQFTAANSADTVNDNFIAPLTHYGILTIEGPDSATFLQGQTTCNINDIDDRHSVPGAYCTAKGRLVSSFHAARSDGEHYHLRMRRDIVDNTQQVLGKYIVFSKAEQRNDCEEFIVFGLQGENAKIAIAEAFGSAPVKQHECIGNNGNIAIAIDESTPRFECWIRQEAVATLWPPLSKNLTPVGSSVWERLIIELGLGQISKPTIEMFIPQMLNMHLTGEISFNKGCYTGQEVVARMHYRGKLKRQMYRIRLETDTVPAAGTGLFRAQSDQSIGNIVNAARISSTMCEALAVITIDDVNNNRVFVNPDIPVEILSLPYAINSKDS